MTKDKCYHQSSTGRIPPILSSAYLYVDYIYLDTEEEEDLLKQVMNI